MPRLIVLLCVLALSSVSLSSVSLGQEADGDADKDGSRFAASLIEGLIANNESLHAYSLAYTSKFESNRPGARRVQDQKVRCYHDPDSERTIVARRTMSNQFDSAGEMKTYDGIFLIEMVRNRQAMMTDSQGKRRIHVPDQKPLSMSIRLPFFHTLGFHAFPDNASSTFNREFWKTQAVSQEGMSSSLINNQSALVRQTFEKDGVPTVKYEWTFDLESLCPTQRKSYYFNAELKKFVFKELEKITWKNFNGIQLPVAIHDENSQVAIEPGSGKRLNFTQQTETNFLWLSVGKPMASDEPAPDQLATLDTIARWIDSGLGEVSDGKTAR
ncbi:hypothetical protein [Rubripirellula reticaptiva]|uniref:Secreted protein n=1 Tax=Rubripirellula reticaptiva TaxID=2528013 RepID=A0A5C6EIS4_9BACT|nr:hypothetical protein [Rubripirellula reticaptiva]TWU47987.1 hypothetical protein Poly59_48310 [Rubripirellula reticaptiva]